jgi:hypothetical protein
MDIAARGPIVFLDVDGPLNPFEAKPTRRPAGYRTHRMRPEGWDSPDIKPLRVWLNPDHGAKILALPGEAVWATTWEEQANRWIAPEIGLPELPVVRWPEEPRFGDGVFWKTRPLVAWAAGRPFVWIDDQITDADLDFVDAWHAGRALLYWIDPSVGLVDDDFETIDMWLRQVGQ